ncbi:MAG: hypothetical protein SNJ57_10080 [Cyanobacteriota bacterium]
MLIFNATKTGLLDRSLNLTSGTFYYHLVTAAPTNPAIAQVGGLAIATGGNYAPAILGAPPSSSIVNQAGSLTTQNPSWNLLTTSGGSIVGSVLCCQAGGSPATTDPPIVYNPLPAPYNPNGSDFTLTPPTDGILRLGYDYIITAVTSTTVTISVAHPVASDEFVGRAAIFSNLPSSSYNVLSNTAASNGTTVLTLQATNLVSAGVTTASRLRFNTSGIIFTQVLLGLLNRSFDLSSGTFYTHLVTTAPTDPTLTQVAQLTLATGGNYGPILLQNLSFGTSGNTALWRADDPEWPNLTTNLAATIKGLVVAKRIGSSPASTDPIVCYKPISPSQFPTGYTPNGASFRAQLDSSTLGLLRFL